MKLTSKEVEDFLGSSNTLQEAIDIIKEVANGDYTVEALKQDIAEYKDGA